MMLLFRNGGTCVLGRPSPVFWEGHRLCFGKAIAAATAIRKTSSSDDNSNINNINNTTVTATGDRCQRRRREDPRKPLQRPEKHLQQR